jgi:predicted RNase H-like HicB family nuclease
MATMKHQRSPQGKEGAKTGKGRNVKGAGSQKPRAITREEEEAALEALRSPVPGTVSVNLPILFHQAQKGGYWAEVPALKGCVSEGETLEETLANIREAAEGWLEVATDRAAGGMNTPGQRAQP